MNRESDALNAAIRKAAGDPMGWDEILISIAMGLADGAPEDSGSILAPLNDLYELSKKADELVINPYFVINGHGDSSSPKTNRLLKHRKRRGIGQSVMGRLSAFAGSVTQVNVWGAGREGHAAGLTALHLKHFSTMARNCRGSKTLSGWIYQLAKMKAHKMLNKGVGVGMALIPGGPGLLVSGAVSTVMAFKNLTILGRESATCNMVAMELHWRAYQEQALLRGGGTGPATAIIRELMTRRGVTRLGGQHDYQGLIKEPAGWHAFSEKLKDL